MTFPGHEENIHWGAMSENIMRIIDLRGKNLSRAELLAAMPRAAMGTSEATDLVRPILDDVKARGAAALRDFGEKFDGVRPTHLRVPAEAMKNALETLDPEVRAAIEESVRRARAVAKSQVPKDFYTDLADGARVAERWVPIQRVGLYVPGRQGRISLLRDHEHRSRTGRWRGIPRHRDPAEQGRPGRPAEQDDSGHMRDPRR